MAYNVGYGIVGTSTGTSGVNPGFLVLNNYTLSCASSYNIVIKQFCVYTNSSGDVQMAIYDSNGALVGSSQVVQAVDTPSWVTGEFDLKLLSGTYYVGLYVEQNVTLYFDESLGVTHAWFYYSSGFPVDIGDFSDWSDKTVSMYLIYDIEYIAGDPAVWAGVWTGSFFIVLLIGILLFKYNVPILGFIYGAFTLGMGSTSIMNSNTLFSPYLELAVFMVAIVLMFYSAKRGLNK